MGFGLLFLGYFIAEMMSFHSFGFVARLCGYVIISVASKKLLRYERTFELTFVAALIMSFSSLFSTVAGIGNILYENFLISSPIVSGEMIAIHNHVDSILSLAFHFALLYAIRKISLVTEVEATAYAASRNFVFLVVYYVLYYVSYLPLDFAADYVKYFSLPVILLYIVCIILNLVLIFKCYANICDETDLDMPRKPSRFAFINKIREESDRRADKAIKSTQEYENKKREERENKKNKKGKRK